MVEVIGDAGPAVLLLPGGAEAVEGFFPGLAEELIADPGCRILLYDRPGNGPSDARDGLRVAAESLHDAIADRKPNHRVRQANALATGLGARLVSRPKAEHAVHLTHPREVLAECRRVIAQTAEGSY